MIEVGRIYNQDWRDVLPLISPRPIVISDPPYNIGFGYNTYKDNLSDSDYIEMIGQIGRPCVLIHYPEETMKYFVPALGVPDEVVAWCYNSNLPGRHFRLISFWGIQVDFNKVKQPYKNQTDHRIAEFGSLDGARSYDWFSDIQLVKNNFSDKMGHPCPVPVKLIERIILLCTNPGDTVFDPFMGSGTTAIAAENTGRKWIGTEIDKTYFEAAQKRIAAELAQTKIF